MGPYVLMLAGVIATAIVCAKGLGRTGPPLSTDKGHQRHPSAPPMGPRTRRRARKATAPRDRPGRGHGAVGRGGRHRPLPRGSSSSSRHRSASRAARPRTELGQIQVRPPARRQPVAHLQALGQAQLLELAHVGLVALGLHPGAAARSGARTAGPLGDRCAASGASTARAVSARRSRRGAGPARRARRRSARRARAAPRAGRARQGGSGRGRAGCAWAPATRSAPCGCG